MSNTDTKNVPFGVKVGYGAVGGASAMLSTMVYIFFLFFLTDVVKLEPAFAGLLLMVGTLWEAFLGPTVGIGSDRLNTRWGRRRPFILAMAIPYGLIVWLLFTNPGLGPVGTHLYFQVMIIAYFTAFTLLEVPHLALAAEMTQDYDERTGLVGLRAMWGQVGSIAGTALPLMLAGYFATLLGSEMQGWSAMAGIFALVSVPLILFTWRTTRGYELHSEQGAEISLKQLLQAVVSNRPFRYTAGVYTFGVIGSGICGALIVYFMTYALHFDKTWSSLAFLILFACGILWVPLINKTSVRFGKRWTYAVYIGAWGIIQGVGIMIIGPEDWLLFFFLLFLASSGVVSLYVIGLTMIADVVEVDEFKSGQRREGLYFGTIVFIQRMASALMLGSIGLVLSWIGYVPNVPQTETALFGIRAVYGIGPAVAFAISLVFCFLMPMTKKNHDALREAMRLKKEGKPYDLEPIADIVR